MNVRTIVILVSLIPALLFPQGINNKGAKIVVKENARITIAGDNGHYTNSGTVDSDGEINVFGNWINTLGNVFTNFDDKGAVVFSGQRNHEIGGSVATKFEALTVESSNTLNIPTGKQIFVRNTCLLNGDLVLNGKLNIEDTLIVSGTITGSGIICFCGTQKQYVNSGIFNNIEINNNNDCALSDDLTISDALIMTSGNLFLGGKTLTMSSGSEISGASSNSFIDASGEGWLKREFSATADTFNFAIGNEPNFKTSIQYYTPVELSFSSASFNNGSVKVRLRDMKHPDNPNVANYLTRYWEVEEEGITNFTYTGKFYYSANDVVGNEEDIFGARYSNSEHLWITMGFVDSGEHSFMAEDQESFSYFTGVNKFGPTVPVSIWSIFIFILAIGAFLYLKR